MFKRILVAVDGSDHSWKAARLAGDFCRSMPADLWVITVFDPIPGYIGQPYLDHAIAARLEVTEELMKKALEEIGDIPGELNSETLEGPVAEAILGVIDARKIELVVMGTRGLGRLQGLVLGSQSQKVVQHATCPVLLVR